MFFFSLKKTKAELPSNAVFIYRGRWPNKFLLGIQSSNGGAYLLLNDKYEIILNIHNSNYAIFTDKSKNKKILSKGSKIPTDKYLYFSFEIVRHNKFLVKEKKKFYLNIKLKMISFYL